MRIVGWIAALASALSLFALAHGEDELVTHKARSWQPKQYPEATLHPRIPYLHPAREWERMDIWVPQSPSDERLPCVIAVYGGGYGDKSGGFINDARPLLARGFVIAAPDYALQTNAPVPLCAWDIAQAVGYLRANAGKYRIDPERIGIWGWSAGGWIAQDLCYAGPERIVHAPTKIGREKVSRWFPMLPPRRRFGEQSLRLQAVVTDWGAQKLWNKHTKEPQPWLSADDPPLFTCYNGPFEKQLVNPVMLTRQLGIPSRAIYGVEGNTHVPKLATPAVTEAGVATSWGESIYDFFERELKTPRIATAPEMIPHGGAIAGATDVRLLTVHSAGVIHYTLDGSSPSENSPRYDGTLRVEPGQTVRAIVVRKGLQPSRVTTGRFVAGPRSPVIRASAREFTTPVGKPFRVALEADDADDALWFIGGKTGQQFREFDGQRFNPPRHVSWLSIDAETGVLSGVPNAPGVYPVIVSCMNRPADNRTTPSGGDAVLIVVTVAP